MHVAREGQPWRQDKRGNATPGVNIREATHKTMDEADGKRKHDNTRKHRKPGAGREQDASLSATA